ncbi:hypothetical protein CEXT_58081 [Caerostris extrusa]|uniref:Uncharacterized protein n=1 Tax=Caerostris extrusa TaxID=172846 RepID=A0AAV4WSX4_CAEEX|nr:hypothetical protein CEXT_58081 [Caerostris extrusa]
MNMPPFLFLPTYLPSGPSLVQSSPVICSPPPWMATRTTALGERGLCKECPPHSRRYSATSPPRRIHLTTLPPCPQKQGVVQGALTNPDTPR